MIFLFSFEVNINVELISIVDGRTAKAANEKSYRSLSFQHEVKRRRIAENKNKIFTAAPRESH